jgi:mRNA interferase RelE/StbE
MSEENGPYTLKISKRARDALERLDKPTAERIVKKLIWLAENAGSVAHGALTGQWSGYFRYRVGSYRVIYLIDHEARVIDVALVGHRREIYES